MYAPHVLSMPGRVPEVCTCDLSVYPRGCHMTNDIADTLSSSSSTAGTSPAFIAGSNGFLADSTINTPGD
jgi:hypothetical protein